MGMNSRKLYETLWGLALNMKTCNSEKKHSSQREASLSICGFEEWWSYFSPSSCNLLHLKLLYSNFIIKSQTSVARLTQGYRQRDGRMNKKKQASCESHEFRPLSAPSNSITNLLCELHSCTHSMHSLNALTQYALLYDVDEMQLCFVGRRRGVFLKVFKEDLQEEETGWKALVMTKEYLFLSWR